jgi:hypothetical protein
VKKLTRDQVDQKIGKKIAQLLEKVAKTFAAEKNAKYIHQV